jgi:hypothetical protein
MAFERLLKVFGQVKIFDLAKNAEGRHKGSLLLRKPQSREKFT